MDYLLQEIKINGLPRKLSRRGPRILMLVVYDDDDDDKERDDEEVI
jgi:hypothetical protein